MTGLMGWALVTRVLSGVALAIGLSLLVPLVLSLLYADGSWEGFLFPAAAMVLVGAGGLRVTGSSGYRSSYVSNRDVYLSVTLAWILSALLGGIPFLIEGTFDNPLDSTFEAMSGFTTTGATLLSDIEAQTPSILFWRSMTQWLGGVGIVVLFVAVAPVLGSGAARLLGAEVSGLTQTRLTPRIADTAKALIVIYLAISLAQTISLLLAGMSLYDAVVHTFATVATGGFSPKTASIGFYDSFAIEAIIIFFMTISGISFSIYYLFYSRRRFDAVLDQELVAYLAILVGATLLVWMVLILEGTYGASWVRRYELGLLRLEHPHNNRLRYGRLRQMGDVPEARLGAADVRWGMRRFDCRGDKGHPDTNRLPHDLPGYFQDGASQGRHAAADRRGLVPEAVRIAVLGLFAAWLGVFGVAAFLVSLQDDLTLTSSVTAVAATLNVVGPGLGQVGASESYEIVNPFGRVILTVCMLLGRLEIFTALALLSPAFWKR